MAQQLKQVGRTKRFQSIRVIFALLMREMVTFNGRTSAGYLWAIAEPLGAIAILSLAFSIMLRSPALGQSFMLFYATGYIPFSIFMSTQQRTAQTLRANRNLLFYPPVSYFHAITARLILNFVTQTLVAFLIFTGVIWFSDLNIRVDYAVVISAFVSAAAVGLGIGSINTVIFEIWPSWEKVWSILTRPLFLASCIFYTYESLPQIGQDILWFNPVSHVVGFTRHAFYPSYRPDYASYVFVWAVALVTLMFGMLLLRKFVKRVINR
ncbi:ABC transporter permease [Paracoccaceae bacterium GXU_MW_L88]